MKKLGLIVLIYSMTLVAHAQVHVWCPAPVAKNTRSTGLHGKDINLVIYDARQITDQTYVACTPADVTNALAARIQAEFPDARFHLQDSSAYFKEPADSAITIKIGIAAYHSGLAMDAIKAIGLTDQGFKMEVPKNDWTSLVGLRIKITASNGITTKTRSKDIASTVNRPDITGQITAKKTLAESYKDVMAETIKFIDSIVAF
ncbi:hypothetical protein SAMN05216436_101358 [bacterium A37T11]|nr:hypothetical protein SAMN05216436_101358 [bacterium A37T11]